MSYFSRLPEVLRSLRLPYQHFVHWNISKVIIWAYSIVLAILLALPWAILLIVIAYQFTVGVAPDTIARFLQMGEINLELARVILAHLPLLALGVLIAGIMFLMGIFAFTYGYLLLQRVHLGYASGERLPYLRNSYFSLSTLWRFFTIVCTIVGLIVAVAIVCIILLIAGLLFLQSTFGGDTILLRSSLGYLTMGLALVFAVSALYIGLRLAFAGLILITIPRGEPLPTLRQALRASLDLTRGRRILVLLAHLIPPSAAIGLVLWVVQIFESYLTLVFSSLLTQRISSIIDFLCFEGLVPYVYLSVFLTLRILYPETPAESTVE